MHINQARTETSGSPHEARQTKSVAAAFSAAVRCVKRKVRKLETTIGIGVNGRLVWSNLPSRVRQQLLRNRGSPSEQ
eukprot:496261-Amphidinium_carterae.1